MHERAHTGTIRLYSVHLGIARCAQFAGASHDHMGCPSFFGTYPASAMTLEELLQKIAQAVFAHDGPGSDHYVRETYDDHVIVFERVSDTYWRAAYSVTDQVVTLADRGEWEQVESVWQALTEGERALMMAAKRMAQTPTTQQRSTGERQQRTATFSGDRIEVRMASDDNRSTFMIMTDTIARDGMVVSRDGLDIAQFMSNPVVLWQHGRDSVRGMVPIGRCVSLLPKTATRNGITYNGWLATVEWETDDFARGIRDQVKNGTLSAASIVWDGVPTLREVHGQRVPYYERSELLEFSIVAVPGDALALVEQRSHTTTDDAPAATAAATAPAAATQHTDTATAVLPARVAPPERVHHLTPARLRAIQQRRHERALFHVKRRLGRV